MTIYTRRGDQGDTDLFSGERVPKDDLRIESYGSVDELNSLLGVVLSQLGNQTTLHSDLESIQNQLHVICANLANTQPDPDRPEISHEDIEGLEEKIDSLQDSLDPLTEFILPGGSHPGSLLHYARSVCRRAERRVIEAAGENDISGTVITYLNRLSDYLFTAARCVNDQRDREEVNPTYNK